jgi:dolichol-phosphate mannosyltransferase
MRANVEPRQIWVVLPTFNEAENITQMLGAITAVESELQILVVDDDSPDGTGKLAEAFALSCPNVHVIHRKGERGLGTAYLAGFRHGINAGAEAILTMDCDFSHDPKVIPLLLEKLPSADLVIGSRYVPGGRIENWPRRRKILSASANSFVRTLFHIPAHDCTSGFRLYRRHLLENIPWQRVRSTGYAFLVETLYWSTHRGGAVVNEVPICFANRVHGESKLGFREALSGVANLIRLRMELPKKAETVKYFDLSAE